MQILLILLLSVQVLAQPFDGTHASFMKWMEVHKRIYSTPVEHQKRFQVWTSNFDFVQTHNARLEQGLESYLVEMNKFADLTNQEFQARFMGSHRSHKITPIATFEPQIQDIPTDWSWVEKGVSTPIKDQGICGSCWAFSAVAAMEGAFNFKSRNGSFPAVCKSTCGPDKVQCCSFSEQEVTDCTNNGENDCDTGGEMHDGIMEIVNNQNGEINTETQYPYVSGASGKLTKCKPKAHAVATGIQGYANVTSGDEDALTQAVFSYPIISVGIDASGIGFQLYSKGVYTSLLCKNKPDDLDHGVAVVGYGTGDPSPPGPAPPPPGPSDCKDNVYKSQCLAEQGCNWCTTASGSGYCFNQPCQGESGVTLDKEWYMVKNSWGSDWGLNGYIAMARNHKNMCGIATDASYVLIN